jgi:hypothetical protein
MLSAAAEFHFQILATAIIKEATGSQNRQYRTAMAGRAALEFLDESQQTTLVSQVDPNLVFHSSLPIGSGHRGFVCCGWDALPSPTPAAAPPASPSAATSKESHDEEQQYRTDGGVDDCADQSSTKMDA